MPKFKESRCFMQIKKIPTICILLVLMLLFAGCTRDTQVVTGRCIKMEQDNYAILIDNTPTILGTHLVKESTLAKLNTGDLLEVTYGETLLTNPTQIELKLPRLKACGS